MVFEYINVASLGTFLCAILVTKRQDLNLLK